MINHCLFDIILHKGVKAGGICEASGMCITVKALYKFGHMITRFFLHEVFVDMINLQTRTPTAVKMLSETMTTTPDYQFWPHDKENVGDLDDDVWY